MITYDTKNNSTPILSEAIKFITGFKENTSTSLTKILFNPILEIPKINPEIIKTEIKKTKNIEILKGISELEFNWNSNQAKPFSRYLIHRAECIIRELSIQPEVFPTARNSIQFEYELGNGDYLEIEIWEEKIEIFADYSSGKQTDMTIPFNPTIINNTVLGFHGQRESLAARNTV